MSSVAQAVRYEELAAREQTGITVRLLWDGATREVWLSYRDLRDDDRFTTPVPAARALEAFEHPNVFRPRESGSRPLARRGPA